MPPAAKTAVAPPAIATASAAKTRSTLRQQVLAARRALTPDQVARLSTAICGHLQHHFAAPPGHSIAFYWPISNEADLRPVINAWRGRGVDISLPVVHRKAAPLSFRRWTPETPMVPDAHGIPTPADGVEVSPDVLVIPVNAFDAAGFRLGYGGGYYDRTLAVASPRPLVIGIGFELARVDSIAPQAHDVPMDWVVTENGIFAPARRR